MDVRRARTAAEPLISYAQNREDILLWRAFCELSTGYYVDVGANSPRLHSVTKLFYDRGWQGINIEPVTSWFNELEAERERDINLKICVAEEDGHANLFEIVGTGLSTMDPAIAASHGDTWEVKTTRRPTRTLASVLKDHALPDIHFLKIDVEGAEAQVLAGADFVAHRPWVVLVESVRPGTEQASYEAWETVLTDADYEMLWFDGLNRFYGDQGRMDVLRHHFALPLSVHDGFVSIEMHEAHELSEERAGKLHELSQIHHRTHLELESTHQRLLREIERAERAEYRTAEAEGRLAQLGASASWRLTKPLRAIVNRARAGRHLIRSRLR